MLNLPPSVRVHQSQWSRLFFRHSLLPSCITESTWGFCFDNNWKSKQMLTLWFLHKRWVLQPPRGIQQAPNSLREAKCTKYLIIKVSGHLDNEFLVDSLWGTVTAIGPPFVSFQVSMLYLGGNIIAFDWRGWLLYYWFFTFAS